MIVVRDFDRLKGKELVATIGFFDGVHLGHRFLIDEMKEIAKASFIFLFCSPWGNRTPLSRMKILRPNR